MASQVYVQAFLLLAVVAGAAYGLKCYSCDGEAVFSGAGSCGDTFDPEESAGLLQTCNATLGEVWCRKEKKGVNHVYTTVERGCTDMCEDQNVAYVKRVACCNSDACNAAGSHVASVGLVLGALLLLLKGA